MPCRVSPVSPQNIQTPAPVHATHAIHAIHSIRSIRALATAHSRCPLLLGLRPISVRHACSAAHLSHILAIYQPSQPSFPLSRQPYHHYTPKSHRNSTKPAPSQHQAHTLWHCTDTALTLKLTIDTQSRQLILDIRNYSHLSRIRPSVRAPVRLVLTHAL
ncbi:hypothetical protein AOQ84DRAFT_164625 [Glonium stellatum]|uniref:Uncharacterized protein n=1 Tax=Glonium stellatum TaxID=574774 RepID=A0A8E2EQA7_9PEZI|nr:hypothetical protein AOQ84DRAFT_164625 [Glonium stellatum]